MVRLADSGNTDAGRKLLELAATCLRDDQPVPTALRTWLAARLFAVVEEPRESGRLLRVTPQAHKPPDFSNDMQARLAHEAFEERVAWAAFHAVNSGEGPTKLNAEGDDTAFEVVATWASSSERVCTAGQVRRWYEKRRRSIRDHQDEIDQITKELESLPRPHEVGGS